MDFQRNLPFVCIILTLISSPISMVLKPKLARRLNYFVIAAVGVMSFLVLRYTLTAGSFVYRMGHFPAPWGNEIRGGVLEGLAATFFCSIFFLCMLGGSDERSTKVAPDKASLYYVLCNLQLCSLLALIYTNDIFTAYVFVEINTISACGLVMIRQNGKTILAATRYMVMSLMGSGFLLMGICFLYSITGELLMSNIQEKVAYLILYDTYHTPLLLSIVLMTVGLGMKSALYPFHSWLPEVYGYSLVSTASLMSSLVSKGYIFLLIKIVYRVVGFYVASKSGVLNTLFVFGVCGMIMGSVQAIRENDIRRMIAYSSVAQIGYIYMGIGLTTSGGMLAAVFHIMSHGCSKAMLFVAASGLVACSGDTKQFYALSGAGHRNRAAGVAFTIGALSMVGFPLTAGFISKILFVEATVAASNLKEMITLSALAISTILNAVYFMRTVLRIYTPAETRQELLDSPVYGSFTRIRMADQKKKALALALFALLNFALGLHSELFVGLIRAGLAMFA